MLVLQQNLQYSLSSEIQSLEMLIKNLSVECGKVTFCV